MKMRRSEFSLFSLLEYISVPRALLSFSVFTLLNPTPKLTFLFLKNCQYRFQRFEHLDFSDFWIPTFRAFSLFSLLECISVRRAFKLLGVCTFPEIGSSNPPVHSQPQPIPFKSYISISPSLPIWISKIWTFGSCNPPFPSDTQPQPIRFKSSLKT